MKRVHQLFTALAFLILVSVSNAAAHCEIPCGIYDDATRLTLIQEHIGTIEKSMNKINELSDGKNPNQLVRWIINKDEHANKLMDIVTQYFMTQRIKPGAEKYNEKLGALHEMLVFSMKCKQTTDLGNVEKLRKSSKTFHDLYTHK